MCEQFGADLCSGLAAFPHLSISYPLKTPKCPLGYMWNFFPAHYPFYGNLHVCAKFGPDRTTDGDVYRPLSRHLDRRDRVIHNQATQTAAICFRFQGRRVRHEYVTMQITFLTRKSALIYRRGLRQRVASLTLNCNDVSR